MSEPETSQSNKLNVDVVSDIVCPWCYVGMRHLEKAIDALPHLDFEIRWRPFQLNPQMPKEGMGREEYMAKKFGSGGPTDNFYSQLEAIGAQLNIDFQFQAIEFAPNTLDAHRLIHWAGGSDANANGSKARKDTQPGKYGYQSGLVTKLFEIYFTRGGDLGEQKVLADAASSLGMNGELVTELLSGERDVDAIKEQVGVAGKMGISGVPCFIVENKYAVMGAQQPEVLVETFEKAQAEKNQPSIERTENG